MQTKQQNLSESSKKLSKKSITVPLDVSYACNMATPSSKPFAIYQTPKGIELRTEQEILTDAELICLVSHYPSAVRIAQQAAQVRHQPFVMGSPSVGFSVSIV